MSNPITRACETFLASPEGQQLCEGTVCGERLQHRIATAFVLGYDAGGEAMANTAKDLIAAIGVEP